MKHETTISIASTGFIEVRKLLDEETKESVAQAKELVHLFNNFPVDESNSVQGVLTEQAVEEYLAKYPDRTTESHWKHLILATGIAGGKEMIDRIMRKKGMLCS